MQKHQNRFNLPPVLAIPFVDGNFMLDADGFNVKIWFVPLQKQQDSTTKEVGYWSLSVRKPDQAYYATQRERPAIVRFMFILMPYLDGNWFTTQTDHECLTWILNLANRTGRWPWWCLCRSKNEFDSVLRVGKISGGRCIVKYADRRRSRDTYRLRWSTRLRTTTKKSLPLVHSLATACVVEGKNNL